MWTWAKFQKFLEDGAFFNQDGFKPPWFVNIVELWGITQAFLIPLGQTVLWLFVLRVVALFLNCFWKCRDVSTRGVVLADGYSEDRIADSAWGADSHSVRLRLGSADRVALPVTSDAPRQQRSSKRAPQVGPLPGNITWSPGRSSIKARLRILVSDLWKRYLQRKFSILYRFLQVCVVFHGLVIFRRLAFLNEPRTFFRSTNLIAPPLCTLSELADLSQKESDFLERDLRRYVSNIQSPLWQDVQRNGEHGLRGHRLVLYRASCDGLGNRLLGLVSAFYYAYMSGRAFLVDWEGCATVVSGTLEDLVDPPFPWNARVLLDRLGVDERYRSNPASDSDRGPILDEFQRIFGASSIRRLSTAYCRPCPERHPIVDLEHLLCEDFRSDPIPVIDFYGTHWTGATIQHNPYLRNASCQRFGNDVFGILARALLKPNAAVQRIVTPITEKMTESDLVIALQLRRRDSYGISALMEEVMWRCAQQIAVLHWQDRRTGSGRDPFYVSNKSSENSPEGPRSKNSQNVLLFVAADNEQSRNRIVDANDNKRSGMRVVYLPSPLTKTKVIGMQYAFAEIYLLSKADEVIISPYSSFGSLAHGWSSKVPWISLRNGKCMRTLSSMPCDVYWFGVQRLPCFQNWMLSSEMVNMESCYG